MKITIYCLLIALALNYVYGQISNAISGSSSILMIQGVSDSGYPEQWLLVENFDPAFPKHGFEPKNTKIFSTYMPYFRRSGDQWEIIFPEKKP